MSENNAAAVSSSVMTEVSSLIKNWEDEHGQPNYDPLPALTRLAEITEVETENYLKMDPDPFDERHPSRTDPDCKLGQILKVLFRKDNFMSKLLNDYLRDTFYSRAGITGRDIDQLNIAACRLLLDVMPGLETTVVFQPDMDPLIHRLIKWATKSIEPLQSYSTGILAAAMELPEIATRFREQNSRLVPLLLKRLRRLQQSSGFTVSTMNRPFAHLSSMKSPPYRGDGIIKITPASPQSPHGIKRARENGVTRLFSPPQKNGEISDRNNDNNDGDNNDNNEENGGVKRKRLKIISNQQPDQLIIEKSPQRINTHFSETSNSRWAELESFMIGQVQIFPPTIATRQILILRYLTPMGEYQEFLSHVFENDALSIILGYVNVRETKQARLAFEALKYLAALLCHKKFSIEFIQLEGLEVLLEVPRPSIAATGVSICLYYLGYSEEAMERVCLLPKYIVSNLVKYALWLLECSHDSGKCHAIMFFNSTFQFKVILDEFDSQDGLRKLHNVIATLPILIHDSESTQVNDDQECAARQIVRHVCLAYRRYLESHLNLKLEPIRRSEMRPNNSASQSSIVSQPGYKAYKSSPEEVQQQIETLLQNMPLRRHWTPVDQLLKLGGITLLLKIISFAYEWNYSGRAETVRAALDVLAICCIMPKVQVLFCEPVDLPEESPTVGMHIILGAAEGEIVADAEVQKAALRVIVNCVCGPIMRVGGSVARFSTSLTNSPNKKTKYKSSEELIQKVCDCVRANSGIMVLLQLMNVKTPITDADCIRTLACKALAGLARSETVRQIVSKLPLFTSGQLQNLMRDPILQEKRQEHVTFQKYALELLERLSGKTKRTGTELEVSLSNIHRANVVAQTKIHFNDKQVLQLIHQHLITKGLNETASMLVKEGNLDNAIQSNSVQPPAKFRYSTNLTPSRGMKVVSFMTPTRSLSSSSIEVTTSNSANTVNGANLPSPAIKIIKKTPTTTTPTTPIHSSKRLQKRTNNDLTLRLPSQNLLEDSTNCVEQSRVTLNSIITEYLTNQHALCKNPIATCPQFNLFVPHKCPDPKPRMNTANNFVVRCTRGALGYPTKAMNRKFIHSRFCPVQSIRSTTDGLYFTCVKFLPGDQSVLVGDDAGDIRSFNLHSGNEEFMFQAHDNYIVHIEPNRTGEFILTSSTWGRPLSALWALKGFEMKIPFEDEEYVEYSKLSQDKILGTKVEVASIYDVNTGSLIKRLVPTVSNQYTKNKATFSPQDDLVLSDGVLFDVTSGKQIHKLDKLNQTQSGVFHPNGLEIVSNTEVWDIRTFHLLKTVPVLNQYSAIFSPVNNAIYAISMQQELDDGDSVYDSSFKTVDALDYSSIATIDVKKNIYDLAINRYDTQIAIVENQGMYQSVQESVVRIYDVGRRRDDEEEQDEDEDDDDGDLDGSDISEASDNEDPLVLAFGGSSGRGSSRNSRRNNNNRRRRNADDNTNNDNNGNGGENNGNNENADGNNDESEQGDDNDDDDDDDYNSNSSGSDNWTSLSSSSNDSLAANLFDMLDGMD